MNHLEAAVAEEHELDDSEIELDTAEEVERASASAGHGDPVAGCGQGLVQLGLNVLIVVDDEDLAGGSFHAGRAGGACVRLVCVSLPARHRSAQTTRVHGTQASMRRIEGISPSGMRGGDESANRSGATNPPSV